MNESTVQEFHLYRKFLIALTESPKNHTSTLDEVFGILWKNGLMDSHVLIQDANKSWSLYTFLPYQKDCSTLNHLKFESITKFNSSTSPDMSIDQLYPEKLRNFNGCPLYIPGTVFPPFITLRTSSDGNYRYEGIDISLLNVISKMLNSTIVPLVKTQHGKLVQNITPPEVFDLVFIHI